MKKIQIFGVVALVLLASCGTAPPASPQVPRWITQPPREEAGSYVFVVSGTSESGNESEAEGMAGTNLQQAIVQEFGVRITATTTAREIGTVDELRRELDNVVQARSSARIRGFRVAERFIMRRGNAVTVYLKALYEKGEFDAEKARVQALFREQVEAVSGPEREGDDFRDRGLFLQAVERYVQAAKASIDGVTGGELDNAEIKYNRNMNKARELLNAMNIVAGRESQETTVGTAFPAPFEVTVVHGPDQKPVPDVQLRFTYRMRRGNRLTTSGASVTSGRDGKALFQHPAPNYAGREQVIVTVDASPFIDILGRVPSRFQAQVNSLEESAAKLRVTINVTVTSNARNVPMAVAISDPNGQVGLLGALSGWRTTPITAPAGSLQGDPASVLRSLRGVIGNRARLAFGTFTAGTATPVGGQSEVRVQGTVQVMDVASGEILYSGTKNRTARGATPEAAEAAAMRQLGDLFGKEMADNLP